MRDTKALMRRIFDSLKKVNHSKFGAECKRFRALDVSLTELDEELFKAMLCIVPFSKYSTLRLKVAPERDGTDGTQIGDLQSQNNYFILQ